ncbi:MAG: TerC family protein [Armatimonadetes bacterium]|nr:TerC family protein [Armatimonadota bacterium]
MTQIYVGFVALVMVFLALDLGVFNRKAHTIETKEALRWTVLWVSCALLFNVGVYFMYQNRMHGLRSELLGDGWTAAMQFFTGYLVEYTLSLDNVFVIAIIFSYFGVPGHSQHRTLFWGILGALIFRGLMIGVGAQMIQRFEWTMYLFGALLLFSAVKMLRAGDEEVEPEHNPLVKFARRLYPVTATYEGERFFTRLPDGRRAMTPLFLVLLVIESTDVMFAVDSIPAIFGITHDPFIVFTSNVFAILGLRSLYFVLAGMMARFHHIKTALVFVLAFIAVKMLLMEVVHISTGVSLLVLVVMIGTGVVASLIAPSDTAEEAVDAALVEDDDEQLDLPGTEPTDDEA